MLSTIRKFFSKSTMNKTYQCSVNGQAVASSNTFEVKNPATGELVGHAPISSSEQVEAAIQAAKAAQPAWAAKSDAERVEILNQLLGVLSENKEYLAHWVVREQGKPLGGPHAMFEIEGCMGWTQVPLSLPLPVEVVFEDDEKLSLIHI